MTNLIIGLCFGIASALALLIMWRVAERLRERLQSADADPQQRDAPAKSDTPNKTS